MPLENVAHGRAASCGSQVDEVRLWNTFSVEGSGREQKFASSLPVVTGEAFRYAGSSEQIAVLTTVLNEFIAFELSLVKEVDYVFTAFRNEVFYAWVVIDSFEKATRMSIYERERAVIDEFPMFEFDFYIVARMGQDAWDLISESVTLAYKRG